MATLTGVISFPIPPYQNLPIQSGFYQPRRFVISDVTLGVTTTITTTQNHDYTVGQLVRLLIPSNFGCFQLNESTGYVLSIPAANEVVIDINSTRNVDPFISATVTTASPQILGIADINNGQINSNGRVQNITYIPGSFINISPL